MGNRIRKIEIHDRVLSPAEAELWVFVEADETDPATEIRGRLVGPTCPYADTVEVAYPLRRFPKPPAGLPPLTKRVVIPEPSAWDPVTPFLYHGPIELWQGEVLCDSVVIRHGLRATSLSPRGLFWNGALLELKAAERGECDPSEWEALHREGINALVLPGFASTMWTAAENLGFAVLARAYLPLDDLLQHTSSPACFGWLIPASAPGTWSDWQPWVAEVHRRRRFIGVEIEQTPLHLLRPEIDFVVAPAGRAIDVDRPKLVRSTAGSHETGELGQLVISANA